MIRSSYRLSFFQVIGVDDSACIPKNRAITLPADFTVFAISGARSPSKTVFLSLECSGVSMFRPQLCIDAETRQDFFHTQFFVQNWKHFTLRYTTGLNYFAHFYSSITQNHIVDFVNHFGSYHFHLRSWTMSIFCGCTATFELIYPIVNRCKHRNRCVMNFIQLSFDLFWC